jgi:transcriptional regulator GlxA family with amidase domain
MQIAWEKLQQGDKVVNVALQVGYQSEAAFSRVFHQQFGQKAGKIRRNQATSQ